MNSIQNNGKNDQPLNNELEQLGHAYGQLNQDEPPELLDQAILNSAHRAVAKEPRWIKFTWLHGLTTTAVFVLAFSLILNQRESAPALENGLDVSVPALMRSEDTAKNQSLRVKVESRKEMKLRDDTRQDANKSTTPVNVPKSKAPAGSSQNQAMEPQLSSDVQDVMRARESPIDQDMEKRKVMLEEVILNEAESMADAPVLEESDQQFAPAAVASPMIGPGEAESQMKMTPKTKAEQKLLEIIKLKQSGDPTWKTELELFMKYYPEYPVPEALKVP